MKRDGMKIGLFVVLVAASGVLFYNQYVRTPERTAPVYTAEDTAAAERQAREHEILATMPGTVTAGS